MSFPFYIASRYLVSKKSRNAINIISIISIAGVAVGTAALIIVLSVFNGFEDLLTRLNNSFDPDIKVLPASGKTFVPDASFESALNDCDLVSTISYTLEENALLQYNDKQVIATVKGVDDNFFRITGLDSMVVRGDALLYNGKASCAIMGAGVAYSMGVICDYIEPLAVSVPSRTAEIKGNFSDAASDLLNSISLYPAGIFAIQQEYDARYVVMPIDEVRRLLEFDREVGAAEIKLKAGAESDEAVKQLSAKLGDKFKIPQYAARIFVQDNAVGKMGYLHDSDIHTADSLFQYYCINHNAYHRQAQRHFHTSQHGCRRFRHPTHIFHRRARNKSCRCCGRIVCWRIDMLVANDLWICKAGWRKRFVYYRCLPGGNTCCRRAVVICRSDAHRTFCSMDASEICYKETKGKLIKKLTINGKL